MDDLNEDDRPEDFMSGELKNENPYIFKVIAYNVWGFLQVYGWGIVILIALAFYIRKKIKLNRRPDPAVEAKKYDNEEVRQKHEAMEDARRRMQLFYSQQASEYQEQQQKLEELKRMQRIGDWERHVAGLGYRSKYRHPEPEPPAESSLERAKKKIFKKYEGPPDYNPLMGPSTGSTYRPPPRRSGG